MPTVAPPSEPSPRGDASPLLDRVVLAVALLETLAYAVVALLRMPYPFELEWMEGGMLTQVQRVIHGQPIYAAPSLSYIPFDYTPLYFLVAALPARWMGEGFMGLRLLSFAASLGCFAIIFALVWRETRRRAVAALAVGLFAATYRLGGSWLDIARPDSLALLFVLAAFLAYRPERARVRGALISGALFALAFLTKQTAIVIAVPLAVHAFLTDRRRFAAFAGGLAVIVVASTLGFDRLSGGWYRYYVFDVAMGHGIDRTLVANFWTHDLLGPLALAILIGAAAFVLPVAGAPRTRGFHGALVAGLVGSAWWLRLYRGSYDNALMPACAAVAILFGLGVHAIREHAAGATPATRAAIFQMLGIAVLVQLALLAWDPTAQLPTRADRAAGDRLVENLRRAPGDVLVPSHPYLAVRAGHAAHFHEVALTDVTGHAKGAVETGLDADLDRALRAHRWAAVVLDERDWLWGVVTPWYRPAFPAFDDGGVFWTRTGMLTRPDSVLVPAR